MSYLYDQLKKIDSELASSLHPHDKQRIMRGLECMRAQEEHCLPIVPKKMLPLVNRPLKFVVFEPNKEIHHKNIEKDLTKCSNLV